MKTAIVMHSVSDAKDCVRKKLHEGNRLFSTHSSVDIYLKERHDLDCRCLSSFLSLEEVVEQKKRCSDAVDALLKDMDRKYAPALNDKFEFKLNYFVPLYSYMSKYHFLGYSSLSNCLKKACEELSINKVFFYNYRFNTFLDTVTDMNAAARYLFDDMDISIIDPPHTRYRSWTSLMMAVGLFKKAFYALRSFLAGGKIHLPAGRLDKSKFYEKRKTIVTTGPLYELEFLKKDLRRYNLFDPMNGRKKSRTRLEWRANALTLQVNDDPIVKLFLRDIEQDFLANIADYADIVNSVNKINRTYGIDMGIWGLPPCWKAAALVYEYLRSEKIKVLGAQHGSVYGDSFESWHFDSDFNRCDNYLSYGFTKSDLERLYPGKKIECEVSPFGKVKFTGPKKGAKEIDILFPITNSVSMLRGGLSRIPPHVLAKRQAALLEYLDSMEDVDVYVKPFACADQEKCSSVVLFDRLKRIKVVDYMRLSDFLINYSPKAVLIEYPSQPLFEVIHLDTEIFLIGDRVIPYERMALEELMRRVHYFETAEEAISGLSAFLSGKLEKKRDGTFYNHYVYKKDTEPMISKLVEELAGI